MDKTKEIVNKILGKNICLDLKSKNKKRSLYEWIRDNRKAIDELTKSPYKNDEERRLWVLNDEGIYNAYRLGYDLED